MTRVLSSAADRGRRRTCVDYRAIRVAAVLVGLSVSCAVVAEEVRGRVVCVSDGGTITVLDGLKKQHKVRLAGIDAPEKGQPFGNASKENLSRLVFDGFVTADCYKRDRVRAGGVPGVTGEH